MVSSATANGKVMVDSIRGSMTIDPPALRYRVALAIGVLFLPVAPALYIAFLGWAGWLLTVATEQLFGLFPGFILLEGILWVSLLALGWAYYGLLIVQLFARGRTLNGELEITTSTQPDLMRFVNRLCTATDADLPKRVFFTTDANASAGYDSPMDWIAGRHSIGIGLPLVMTMSAREFAAVLAHEICHTTQRDGRWVYVLARVDRWFYAMVFERSWLERLLFMSEHSHPLRHLIFAPAWIAFAFNRTMLAAILRQREFHADRLAARVGGSEAVAESLRKSMHLGHGQARTTLDHLFLECDRQLVDDIPQLIVARAEESAMPTRRKLNLDKTRFFDTHPCYRERCEAVARLDDSESSRTPLVDSETSSHGLVRNIAATCKAATRHLYQQAGVALDRTKLIPANSALANTDHAIEALESYNAFTSAVASVRYPLQVKSSQLGSLGNRTDEVSADLRAWKTAFEKLSPELPHMVANHTEAHGATLETDSVARLAGIDGVDLPAQHPLRKLVRDSASTRIAQLTARREFEEIDLKRANAESAIRARLTLALVLLGDPRVRRSVVDGERHYGQSKRLYPYLKEFAEISAHCLEIERIGWELSLFRQCLSVSKDVRSVIPPLEARWRAGWKSLSRLFDHLARIEDPFAGTGDSIASFNGWTFDEDDPAVWGHQVMYFLTDLEDLYGRVLGQLSAAALAVEASFGFPAS